MTPTYTWKDADGNVYYTMTISEYSNDLMRHKKAKHKESGTDKYMPCVDCLRKFASVESLMQHRRDKHNHGEVTP